MLTPDARLRQAITELTRRFGGKVPDVEIFEAAAAAYEALESTATVSTHLAVLTARRAARELALTAVGVQMPVQQKAGLTAAR
ncbi:three-helix bundle dimerization domain-containing protein [Lentzea sp. NPDC051838]|uniref:three-helix bundle dimerization domain-containing protein n=1 Tax=Lentzea sp. NPDC051838 TaxID=3154849 RepID=UPI00342DC26F